MMPGRTWNRVLLLALFVMFSLNTWLVRILVTVSDSDGSGDSDSKSLVKQRDTLLDTVHVLQAKCKGDFFNVDQQQVNSPTDDKAENTDVCLQQVHVDSKDAIILGHQRNTKGFLTIGIPTVKREKKLYIQETLNSLIEHSTRQDRKDVVIVIFAADFNNDYNNHIKDLVESNFKEYVNDGFIQVIKAPESFYPPLENLKQNFGDELERVIWRSKQVVDYAYLFSYSIDVAQYYIQLEDDVIATPNYVQSIREYIDLNQNEQWVCLEFSELGFIGKLFRSSMLQRLSQFVMFFFEEQPIDYLFKYFNLLHAQQKSFLRAPSIFQHIGTISSLRDKEQVAQDRFFETKRRAHGDSNNPPARVFSNMTPFSMYLPNLAYSNQPGYFWGKAPISAGDYLLIVFDQPVRLKRVLVDTGSDAHPQDILQAGVLEVSRKILPSSPTKGTPVCTEYEKLGKFTEKGQIDVDDLEKTLGYDVVCLRITMIRSQVQWLVVQEIAVWTAW
ncbi:LOW QUALITY PROTEIN: alpha-1,6-mannosyl-glycoprotein 4-beta-N-acetylglucosaminyltransferase-like [Amphiura filiformis]|uniref:LOW QUALITY PROTEIN: alpha-1,6-mannosyl-glycoprotein 4-beta-N-acetylglucosaminyltransferase-like n=1 Tax=Amphiura filiformis TaxID=82378 RepID=UPI003B225AF5